MSTTLNDIRRLAGLPPSTSPNGTRSLSEAWDKTTDAKLISEKKKEGSEEEQISAFDRVRQDAEARKAAREADRRKEARRAGHSDDEDGDDKEEKKEKAEKKERVARQPKEKSDAEPAEKRKRGAAVNPDSKASKAKSVLKNMTRKEFMTYAANELGMSPHYASAFYAKHNPKSSRELKEASVLWMVTHPMLKGFMLAENRALNLMQWIDSTSALEPLVFVKESDAKRVAQHMSEWKNQRTIIEQLDMEEVCDEDDDDKEIEVKV